MTSDDPQAAPAATLRALLERHQLVDELDDPEHVDGFLDDLSSTLAGSLGTLAQLPYGAATFATLTAVTAEREAQRVRDPHGTLDLDEVPDWRRVFLTMDSLAPALAAALEGTDVGLFADLTRHAARVLAWLDHLVRTGVEATSATPIDTSAPYVTGDLVDTLDELVALEVGSVVQDQAGDVCQRQSDGETFDEWRRVGQEGPVLPEVPALVLVVGGAQ